MGSMQPLLQTNPKSPTLIKIWEQASHLSLLIAKAKWLLTVNDALHLCLGPEIAHYYQVANFHQGTLVIFVPTGSWRMRLQFLQTQILKELQARYPEIKLLEIKIKPNHPEQQNPFSASALILSDQSRAIIEQTAHTITDESLKKALLRLAKLSSS